jgi:nicotinamidase-related amidase
MDGSDATHTALLVVDVLNHFDHEDGEVLLRAFAARTPAMRGALDHARRHGQHVVYANDDLCGDGDAASALRQALAGAGGDLVAQLAPAEGEPVVVKPGHSAFAGTPTGRLLRRRGVRRVAVMGAVAEMCVLETAADALAEGFAVEVLADASVPLTSDDAHATLQRLERQGARVIGAEGRGQSDRIGGSEG